MVVAIAALLDLGVQSLHITNQSIIYKLDTTLQSRVTTVYMTSYFAGGIFGSSVGTLCYAKFGYVGSGLLGVAIGIVGLGVWSGASSKELFRLRRAEGKSYLRYR